MNPESEQLAADRRGRGLGPLITSASVWSLRILLIAGAAVVVLWLASQLRVVLIPLAIATIASRVLRVPSEWLRRRGLPAGLAAAAVVIGFVLVAVTIAAFVVGAAAPQFSDLGPTVTEALDGIEDWIVDSAPVDVSRSQLVDAREMAGERISESLASSNGSLMSAAGLLVELFTGAVLGLFLTFFIVKDGELFVSWARRFVPWTQRGEADAMARRSWDALAGYLRGATALGALEGVIISTTMAITGASLALPIALVTFIGAYVPIVGAIVSGVLAVLVTLVTAGVQQAVIVGVVALVVQQLDNDLLAPFIYGRALQIPPALILISVVAGGALFGLAGTFFAVPVTAVLFAAFGQDDDDVPGGDDVAAGDRVPDG